MQRFCFRSVSGDSGTGKPSTVSCSSCTWSQSYGPLTDCTSTSSDVPLTLIFTSRFNSHSSYINGQISTSLKNIFTTINGQCSCNSEEHKFHRLREIKKPLESSRMKRLMSHERFGEGCESESWAGDKNKHMSESWMCHKWVMSEPSTVHECVTSESWANNGINEQKNPSKSHLLNHLLDLLLDVFDVQHGVWNN